MMRWRHIRRVLEGRGDQNRVFYNGFPTSPFDPDELDQVVIGCAGVALALPIIIAVVLAIFEPERVRGWIQMAVERPLAFAITVLLFVALFALVVIAYRAKS